ncbi:TIGR02285 family protein [Pseudomonas donghuensis]|uniref:TIGR02285 family protein n=1 Tax=Pseudomonas donghuensis TaxID=1163398 RepID=UPI002E1057A7|nr:TIGR02285 family protein [Pseudomonas donghuensis]
MTFHWQTSLRRGWPLLLGLLLSLGMPTSAWAKERLFWLLRDLPPLTIFEGTGKGQGAIDQLLALLIEQMPEYDHSIVRVNRARGIQMLQEPTFTCDPTLLWTPERARYVHFSIPSLGVLSSGLVVRRKDQHLLEPYLQGNQVDLPALLGNTALKLGVVAQRSYSTAVDELLKTLPDTTLSRHYGNDAVTSLLQMQQHDRLQLVLGYWPEVRYLLQQQGWSTDDYTFFPIQGVEQYQLLRVGCSDTPLGREAISHINKLLLPLRNDTLPDLYAQWLAPQMREQYVHDSQRLFGEHD